MVFVEKNKCVYWAKMIIVRRTGGVARLVGRLPRMCKSPGLSPVLSKLGVMVHGCNLGTPEVEIRGSEVQDYTYLQDKF